MVKSDGSLRTVSRLPSFFTRRVPSWGKLQRTLDVFELCDASIEVGDEDNSMRSAYEGCPQASAATIAIAATNGEKCSIALAPFVAVFSFFMIASTHMDWQKIAVTSLYTCSAYQFNTKPQRLWSYNVDRIGYRFLYGAAVALRASQRVAHFESSWFLGMPLGPIEIGIDYRSLSCHGFPLRGVRNRANWRRTGMRMLAVPGANVALGR